MNQTVESEDALARIVQDAKVVAVIGMKDESDDEAPAFTIPRTVQSHGLRVIPVNPNETEVFGEKAYADLASVPSKVELVDVFRRSEEAGKAVDEAIAVGAKAVWLQEGVIDNAAAQRAVDAGLLVVMDRCWLKEHMRHGRR